MTDSENLIISAPNITPGEVKNLLGNPKTAVYNVCLSPNINEWSRYKPIYKAGRTGIDFHFRAVGYDAALHGLVARSYASWNSLANALISDGKLKAISDWSYDQNSLKTSLAPKRLGDFDGYYHKATPPFAGFFCPPTLGNKTVGTQQKAYLLPALSTSVGADSPTAPGSIGLSQIEAPAAIGTDTATLDEFFFGVALVSPNDAAVVWAASEGAVVNSDGTIIQHTYDVPMSLTSVAAGTYYAVPVLTRARVSSTQSTPQQICLVPNCSPVRVTVTDSATVNEDMEVVFTTCKFIAANGSTDGLIQSIIRVENKGGYNKRCTYKAFTTSGGSATEENVETGEFNVAANSSYSLRYVASASYNDANGTTVHVRVSSAHADGTPQVITASTVPLVPAPTE